MSLIGNLKKSRPWEWVVLVLAVGLLAYAFGCLHGCASIKAASEHGAQLGIGTAVGSGAGLLAGATGWGVLLAALIGAAGAILSQPEVYPGGPPLQIPQHPLFSLVQYVIVGAVLYVLWIRRARIMDAIRSRGEPSMMFAHLAHAFLGTARPGEKR